jgi:dimethylargininase
VCARLDDERVLVAEGALPDDTFGSATVVRIPAAERYAANALAIGGTVLCAEGFPQTLEVLTAAGFKPIPLDTSEARKADGALTCMSILI